MAEKRSTSAKKTTPTKKSTSAKATAPTRKATTTKKTASARTSQSSRTSTAKKPSAGTASSSGSSQVSAADVALSAAAQLMELTGRGAEGVTGIEKTEEGWRVQVEVVELRRIPETTDLLATYEVTMSDSGTMSGYRRLRRYSRGSTSDG
jgi:hypothetical protein